MITSFKDYLKEVFHLNNKKLFKTLNKFFSRKEIDTLAINSGFKKRNRGKITPLEFLHLNCFSGNNICTSTLEELTSYLEIRKDIEVSPQALDQRYNLTSIEFFKRIFIKLCELQQPHLLKAFKSHGFNKIFLMDSTEIKLHPKLKDVYKGTTQTNPATLKINLLMELLNYSVENIEFSNGRKNEQNFSKHIYDKLSDNSLVLKDLGYFKFDDFNIIDSKNSFFISRLRAGTRLFSLNPKPKYGKNGKMLVKSKYLVTNAGALGNDLKPSETREYNFLVGSHEPKQSFRIIVTKLEESAIQEKLKEIKKREERGKTVSKLARDSAQISGYITNVKEIDLNQIIEIYRLRWQIELLFKFFKSDFQLDKIKNLKIERIETHLYATLIKMILLLEITKNIYDGFPKEMSIRRVLKSSLQILDGFLNLLKCSKRFERLNSKIRKIIDKKKKVLATKSY